MLREQLAGIDGAFGLGTPLDGEWLNNLTRWALGGGQVCQLAHLSVGKSQVWLLKY